MAKVDNLQVQEDIQKVLKNTNAVLKKNTSEYSRQLAIQLEQLKVLKEGLDYNEDTKKNIDEAAKSLAGLSEELDNTTSSSDKAKKSFRELIKESKVLAVTTKTLKLAWGGVKFAIGAAFTVMTAALIGGASLYKKFHEQTDKVYGKLVEIARAGENIRKEFGDISTGTGKDVLNLATGMGKAFNKFGVGLRFGYDAAIQLREMALELASGMGAAYEIMRREPMEVQQQMVILSKGMGLTAEEAGKLTKAAESFGQSGAQIMKTVSEESNKYAMAAGVSSKQVAKDVSKMTVDVKHFGGMTVAQMSRAASRVRALGMEMSDLTGLAEKFDDFESAADSVSKLTQVFGVNVDTMRMMRETDPTKRIDMLRKSFFAAGKSAEQMSRQELKLLASQTGLSEENARLAFSQKSRWMSEKQLEKEMKKQKSPQEKMVDTLERVASSIERVVNSLEDMGIAGKTFFGSFITGFKQALFYFGKFAGISDAVGTLKTRLRLLGEILGKDFYNNFKGVKGIFESLENIFRGKEFFNIFDNFSSQLKTLFSVIKEGDPEKVKSQLKTLFSSIKDSFKQFLKSDAAQSLKGSVEEFLKAVGDLLKQGWEVLKPHLIEMLTNVGNFIWDKLGDVLGSLWENHKKKIILAGMGYLGILGGELVVKSIAQNLSTSLGKAIIGRLPALAAMVSGPFSAAMAALGPIAAVAAAAAFGYWAGKKLKEWWDNKKAEYENSEEGKAENAYKRQKKIAKDLESELNDLKNLYDKATDPQQIGRLKRQMDAAKANAEVQIAAASRGVGVPTTKSNDIETQIDKTQEVFTKLDDVHKIISPEKAKKMSEDLKEVEMYVKDHALPSSATTAKVLEEMRMKFEKIKSEIDKFAGMEPIDLNTAISRIEPIAATSSKTIQKGNNTLIINLEVDIDSKAVGSAIKNHRIFVEA